MRQIPRSDLRVTSTTVVFEKHFVPEFTARVDSATREDGSILTVVRKNPKLTSDAYPTLFPNTPAYLSTEPPKKRKKPDERRIEMAARDDEQFEQWLANDRINSFDDLNSRLDNFISGLNDGLQWFTLRYSKCVCISLLDFSERRCFNLCVKISDCLHVDIYEGESHVRDCSLLWLLGSECKVTF